MSPKPAGPEGFEAAYAGAFGGRWPLLRAALLAPVRHAAWLNPFVPAAEASLPPEAVPLPGLPECRVAPRFPPPPEEGALRPYYLLDPASVAAARALEVQPGDRVLDMAAAPGGKSLVLAAGLGETGRLTANDRSAARRARLHRVLDAYLPLELRARVEVTGHDGARFGLHRPGEYDRVLLDAPCSSERHVLTDPAALGAWTAARTRQLARRQYAMLAAAADAVRPGGRVVYATCALSDDENDAVVARIVKRRALVVRPPFNPLEGEATVHGVRLLPDRGGFGPLYYAVLERLE